MASGEADLRFRLMSRCLHMTYTKSRTSLVSLIRQTEDPINHSSLTELRTAYLGCKALVRKY